MNRNGQSANGEELAALYARVSTSGQLDNTSSDSQLQRGREYCAKHNYTIVTTRVEAIGGTFVLARSAFNELLNMAADRQITAIVVDIPDRLGRGDAIAKLELLADMNGARIEYATPGRDTSTVEGLALHATDQLVSGIERMNIRRRTMGGKYEWAGRGRIIATALRPYGYCFVNQYDERGRKMACHFEIVESEARVVRDIYEWLVSEGMTIKAIARRLTENGVPKMTDTDKAYQRARRKKYGTRAQWGRSTIARILTSTTYKGEWRYGKNDVKKIDTPDGIAFRVKRRAIESTVIVPVPPIVSPELWDAAQDQLKENSRKFRKPARRQYLLRGRIRCAICGMRLVGRYHIHRYYTCGRNTGDYVRGCHTRYVRADAIEPTVWNAIRDAMLDKDRLWIGLQKRREEAKRARRIVEQSIAALEVQNAKAQARLDRLLDLYTAGDLEKKPYLAKKREIDKEIEGRTLEQGELERRLEQHAVLSPEQEMTLRQFQDEIAGRMTDDVPFEEKAKLLDLLRVECIYDSRSGDLVVSGLMGSAQLSTIP